MNFIAESGLKIGGTALVGYTVPQAFGKTKEEGSAYASTIAIAQTAATAFYMIASIFGGSADERVVFAAGMTICFLSKAYLCAEGPFKDQLKLVTAVVLYILGGCTVSYALDYFGINKA